MRYVECGDIRTSALGFGCGSVMGRVGRGDSLRAMNAAWDAGVRLFDVARSYGYGEAEGLLGEFLEGRREEATIVTKFGILPQRSARWKSLAKPLVRGVLRVVPQARTAVRRTIASESSAGNFDVRTLRLSLEESLRQLRTDRVDVLLLHEPPISVLQQDDLMAELAKVVAEGKARRAGISTTPEDAASAMERGLPVLRAFQFAASLQSARPAWSDDRVDGMFLMANHPFGGVREAARLAATIARMASDRTIDSTLRDKLHGDPKEMAAKFVFSEIFRATRAHAILPSMLHLDNLRANVAAMDALPLTAEESPATLQAVGTSARQA